MTSFFQYAMQTDAEEPEEINPIFSQIKEASKENIIPPVGIANPELVESFIQNMGDEEKILKAISDVESYQRENIGETVLRETAAHAARGAEGLFGGIMSFLNMLVPEQVYEEESGETERFPGNKLPGTQELHEFTKEKTGKYLEPKGKLGKVTQEVASDFGSLFSSPDKTSALTKFGAALGGQIIKQGVKASGGGETAQDLSKLGFMGLASIARLGNAPKVASQALNEAENIIPKGLAFSAKPTENAFQRIKNSNWFKSGSTPSKAPAMAELERIEKQISNGKINGHMAMQLRRDINEARKKVNAFDLSGPPIDKKAANFYLDRVDDALMESMESYGKNVNPEWLKKYKLAQEAFAVTRRSRLISDVVEKYAKPLQSQTAKTLFHVGGGAALTQLPTLAAAALPVVTGAKMIQIMNRMIKSPVLRNHYLRVLKAAATENVALIQKEIEKFDKAAKSLEKSNSQ